MEPEIKYAFLRTRWGRGLATEAVDGLLGYGRDSLGLRGFIASIADENVASHRILAKVGMRPTTVRPGEDGQKTQYCKWIA